MAGSGFYNGSIMFADNVSFDGTDQPGKVTLDGQLLIGSSVAPNIRVATLASADNSITITNGNGTIDLSASGTVTSVLTANATPQFALVGSTSTVDFDLTNLVLGTSTPLINVGTGNVGIGQNVMVSLTNGSGNTVIGHLAAQALDTGSNNVAIGKNSLIGITGSVQNVAVGHSALVNMTTSVGSNTAVGYAALDSITTGTANIGLGAGAGDNFSGIESSNILIGSAGVNLDQNTIRLGTNGNGVGQQNKAFIAGITGVTVASSAPIAVNASGQFSSLGFGTSGQVLKSNGALTSPTWQTDGGLTTINGDTGSITGSSVTIFSNRAINNSGSSVKFVNSGTTSTFNVTDVLGNTMVGYLSGNLTITGEQNTAFGSQSLSALTSAFYNCAFGDEALKLNQTGQGNTAVGWSANSQNLSGSYNVAVGMQALENGKGGANIAMGYQAMFSNSTTSNSICLGYQTGYALTGGTANVAIGILTMNALTTGSSNTIVGNQAGQAYTSSESNNILIGNGVAGTTGESNITRLGSGQTACFISGITGVTITAGAAVLCDASGQLGTVVSSERYKENIVKLEKESILSLTPVSFNHKTDKTKTKVYGLVAEDVHEKFPDLCIYKNDMPDSVKYHEMTALLLLEIQKLEKRVTELEGKKKKSIINYFK